MNGGAGFLAKTDPTLGIHMKIRISFGRACRAHALAREGLLINVPGGIHPSPDFIFYASAIDAAFNRTAHACLLSETLNKRIKADMRADLPNIP